MLGRDSDTYPIALDDETLRNVMDEYDDMEDDHTGELDEDDLEYLK